MIDRLKTAIAAAIMLFAGFLAADQSGYEPAEVVCHVDSSGSACSASGDLHPGGRKARVTDRFAIASVGKTATAVLILQLAEQNKLQLSDSVDKHLPQTVMKEFPQLSGVSLRNLLEMSSELPDYYDEEFALGLRSGDIPATPLAALRHADIPRVLQAGQRFHYSNTNYVLLQLVIEHRTGHSYADAMRRTVLNPAGMQQSFVFGDVPLPDDFVTGYTNLGAGSEPADFNYESGGFGDGGLVSSAPDLLKFYRALWIDKILLREEMLTELTRDRLGKGYGLGVVIGEYDGLFWGHNGADLGFRANAAYWPDSQEIAVHLRANGPAKNN